METGRGGRLAMEIRAIERAPAPGGEAYRPVLARTSRGDVAMRYYPAGDARAGAIYVGGVGGGWDTPAEGLYPRLCEELTGEGIAGLRVHFRHPTVLDEAVLDVLAGVRFLEEEGIGAVGLVGHSFGGAAVIRAAAQAESVRTVVTLATQGYGADPVSGLGPRCSILLIHGTGDEVLPASASQHVHRLARDPKELILYPAAGHTLDGVAGEVYRDVREWLRGMKM